MTKNPLRYYVVDNKKILLKKVITPNHIAKYAKILSRNKKDAPIAITGYPGEGKSVLAREICKAFDRRYDDERNCIYDRKELLDKIESFPPSGFNIDEAINLLYKRDWNKGGQKELIKILNICRSKKHLILFVQPDFMDLDKDIRETRIRLWIFVIKRGIAAVLRPERNISGGIDPWNLDELNKEVKKQIKLYGQTIGTIEGLYRSKNFISFLRWNDINEDEYNSYEAIKDRKKYEGYSKEETLLTPEMARKQAIKLVYEVCSVLEVNNKLRKFWNTQIVAPYLKISAEAGRVYYRQAKLGLGISEDRTKVADAVNIDELEYVKLEDEEDKLLKEVTPQNNINESEEKLDEKNNSEENNLSEEEINNIIKDK